MPESKNKTIASENEYMPVDTDFEKEQLSKVLSDRAKRFGHKLDSEDEDLIEMIVFSQETVRYAVPIETLSETRIISKVTFLPLVSRSIIGVVNVRGRIVAIYSLSEGELDVSNGGFALVGSGDASHVAVWADDIIGTVSVSLSELRSKPISLADKDYIKGVGSDGMIFLDLEKFITNKKLYLA